MVDSFNRLGFGYVGLASAQTLVSPRRLGGASSHRIRNLFLERIGNLKLGHYRRLRGLDQKAFMNRLVLSSGDHGVRRGEPHKQPPYHP
jgi:hypothetical protein